MMQQRRAGALIWLNTATPGILKPARSMEKLV